MRLLFVDDEPSIRRSFVRTLERRGYRVDATGSPLEAVRMMSSVPYPVVVTDLRMPGMDGLSLIDRLSELRRETVFVIVTGMPEIDLQRIQGGRVVATVAKPWAAKELLNAIEAAVSRSTQGHSFPSGHEQGIGEVRVLLVEDDPLDTTLTLRRLRGGGFVHQHIEQSTTLDDALRKTFAGPAELILVDLHLPDAAGDEVVRRLHAAAPGAAIVAMSGQGDEAAGLRAIRLGAQDFIDKDELSGAGFLRAVTYALERKRAEQRLSRLTRYDALTNLANRSTFQARLGARIQTAPSEGNFGVIAIDLDRFKHVNDSLGHDAGDLLLHEVGARLLDLVGDDRWVARLGGDEFALLVEETVDARATRRLAERLLEVVRKPIVVKDETIVPSCSIGIALYPSDGRTAEELLGAADQSMYSAKRTGRDRIVLATDDEPRRRSSAKLLLSSSLASALRRGDFELHYQPQFSLDDGKLVGFEALLRYRDGGELIGPADFIPTLEEGKGILAVGRWALDQACRQLRRWIELRTEMRAEPIRMAVNLSTVQLEDPLFIQAVEASLRVHGVPPELLELEITESILMADTDRSRRTLERLKSTGVRLAIDDFGTGYSSLAYLHRFHVDLIKIDRTFVAPLGLPGNSEDSGCVVAAIIELGRNLQVELLAEGVETAQQLDYLTRRGCHFVQGHLFGRPTPASKAEAYVATPTQLRALEG